MDRPLLRPLMIALPLLLVGGAGAWWWSTRPAEEATPDPLSNAVLDQRLLAVEQAIASIERGQSRTAQRLADLEARSTVQREELLGWGQRTALLEESVQQVSAGPQGESGIALRLDEVDLLLSFAEMRLALSGDIDGARRAYAFADGLLSALTAPQYVNLRQSLAQEQAALAALPTDPGLAARGAIDAIEAALPALEAAPAEAAPAAPASALDKVLDALVDVRPRGAQDLLAPADRQRGLAALRLELGLARLAIERRDSAGLAAAATRAKDWMRRLYTAGDALDAEAARLDALASTDLAIDVPVLGSTLAQLRAQRRSEGAR
ncbi:uroporphyrinogen-III C-methyltransferase [Silanimonas sp.]|uniref:uroporphyrinogen-III C-methyltransferase n=1 Tax=Silanimonas sp. TaxID=1929290 RepID=UPI0026370ABA|nr:uroporphyrinogen-III C-methyltransferase [Silanimonas sp.]